MEQHKLFASICATLLLCTVSSFAQTDTIFYELADNTLEETFIGNIVSQAGLQLTYTTDILETLSYIFLTDYDYLQYFKLEETTGNIQTSQLLDRDVVCSGEIVCQLKLDIAIQPNNYFAIIHVFITISDENDNAPQFEQNQLTYELPESTSPGLITPLIPAKDIDSPANGIKGYKLIDDSNKFQLEVRNNTDYSSLEVSLMLNNSLNREETGTYLLQVIAYDGGESSRSGTLDLTIKVLDVNDNHPVFQQRTYDKRVPEQPCEINSTVFQVIAVDGDSGNNGFIVYSFNQATMSDVGDTFSIEPHTGKIKLKKCLDFESRMSYSLTVVASDQGINSIQSTAKVIITVDDFNDIAPEVVINDLPEDGIISVMENLPANTFVAHLSIHDRERGQNGRADCIIEHTSFFEIEFLYEKEYKIVTKLPINREDHPQLFVTIICNDFGETPLRGEKVLQVNIGDENDNPPVFESTVYKVEIEEGNTIGSRVTKVQAFDLDIGLNGEVRYRFSPVENPYFEINTVDGVIIAKQRFDREEQERYDLTVLAMDLGDEPKIAEISVVIDILDVDDNTPTFIDHAYNMNVTENVLVGSYIGSVYAQDLDGNRNNQFHYYLSDSDIAERKFVINNKTGAIYSNFSIDRELKQKYSVTVVVLSVGNLEIQDSAIVTIDILDDNDNLPIISFPSSQANHIILSNQAPVGYKVTKIIAYDIDAGNNSALSYQLSQDQEKGEYFYIDSDTGNVYINKELWDITEENFTIQVLVSDFGIPRKTSVSSLFITVNNTVIHDPLHSSTTGVSDDLIAIVIGCICGALIAILLIILVILLILRRRRRKDPDVVQSWVMDTKKVAATTNTTIENRHIGGNGREDQVGDALPVCPDVVGTSDVGITLTGPSPAVAVVLPAQRSHSPAGHVPGEKDSDSGCFDLSHSDSQSSNEGQQYPVSRSPSNQGKTGDSRNDQNKSQQPNNTNPPTVIQTKCYHPQGHTCPPNQMRHQNSNSGANPMSTFSPQPPYPAPQLNGSAIPQQQILHGLDFVQPQSLQHQNNSNQSNKPKPPPRFSDYLQNESQQLKQRGHVYRVSSPNRLKPSGSVKKTVRFSEPENTNPCDNESNNKPRAVPNDYVTTDEVAGYKQQNSVNNIGLHPHLNNLNHAIPDPTSSITNPAVHSNNGDINIPSDDLPPPPPEFVSIANESKSDKGVELTDSAIHLNSLV